MAITLPAARLRLLVVLAALLAVLSPAGVSARQTAAESDCAEGSTPRLVITGGNPAPDGIQLTLVAQTGNDGSAQGNVHYEDGPNRLISMEMHRVFLHEEPAAALEGEGEHEEGVRAALRGVGQLAGGELVRVQIDIQDRGDEPYQDRFRIRWRPFQDEHELAAMGDGGCTAEWQYNSGWRTVQRIKILQR